MKRCTPLAVLAGLLAWTNAAQAQEFTIKLKERGENEPGLVKRSEITKSKVAVADAGGNVVLDQVEAKTEVLEYKETFLKRDAGKTPTKLMREYTKVLSVKDDDKTVSPLQGKTVVIEKKAGKYSFTYKDGEALEEAEAKLLAKDFDKKSESNAELEKLVLPPGPVKVGDTWKIEMPRIVKELAKDDAMELDAAKATGQGKLVKTYKKNDMQFGEMQFKMELPLVTIGKGKEALKFGAGAKIAIDLTIDVCIDGTSEAGSLKMKMLMNGNATIPSAPGATATLNVTVDATQSQVEVGKK